MQLFHGSSDSNLSAISNSGIFGGLFASEGGAASSHGDFVYLVTSPRPLTDYALNYEIEGAYEMALAVADGNESIADAILDARCPELDDCDAENLAEQGWEFQRLRGELAAKLGYTSVEMQDEHGTTWLCLPGCSIQLA